MQLSEAISKQLSRIRYSWDTNGITTSGRIDHSTATEDSPAHCPRFCGSHGDSNPEHSTWRCQMSPAITPRACPSPVSSMKNSTNKYQEEANSECYSETKLLKAVGGIFPGLVWCGYPETQQVLKTVTSSALEPSQVLFIVLFFLSCSQDM